MDTDTRISVIAGRPGAGKTRWAAREVVETLRDVNNIVIYIGFDREFERICRMVSDTYGSKPHGKLLFALQDGAGEQGNVFGVLAQGRGIELDDVEAVVEVLAKVTFFDKGGEVFVGGGDDAHVHGFFMRGADGAHGAFLDGAQEFDLHGER